ncbi:MAG: hypothetical protein LBV04_01620 [Deferribacteraceae bacterium]|jgi:hypothetical protein|nr:hypothetical protein [Deferribacteraceae bacterium]
MQYNIKLVKLVTGETIMANFDEGTYKEPVLVQTIPTASGAIQLAILPYGFPYDQEIVGAIDAKHVIFEYKTLPEEMRNKYLEAKSNIKIVGGMGGNSESGIIL